MSETLLIRADASPQIGIGHVMRCLALGQAWQAQGGTAVFACAALPRQLEERLEAEGFRRVRIASAAGGVEDAAETATLARCSPVSCIVLDGYHFGVDYLRALAPAQARTLLVVDDVPEDDGGPDFVLDQNLGAREPVSLRKGATTRFLLGPRFALLRREFWPWRGWTRPIPQRARRLLVTFGGSDPENLALRVVRALRTLPESSELDVRFVVGPANRHRESLEDALRDAPPAWRVVTPSVEMPELMAWAELGISAAGSTCWELAFLGLPFVTIVLADNQRSIARGLAEAGISRDLGWHEEVSAERLGASVRELLGSIPLRVEMSRRGQETVDGLGAERVASLLTAVAA